MASSVENTPYAEGWNKLVSPYREPILSKSIWQLVNTLTPYAITWALMIYSLDGPYWITASLSALAGLLTVRLFIINHDCGHGSFFKSRRANDIVGFWTGAAAFTPYLQWRHGHSIHHAKSGQIEEAGIGYFWIMGVEEFKKSSWLVRGYYRFYRNPFVLFGVGGLWLFLCEFRLSFRSVNWRQRRGVWANNILWAAIVYGMGEQLGYYTVFLLLMPLATSAAFWGLSLFYVQHHYEHAYWSPREGWSYERAGLEGSSYLELHPILEWFAGNINYHHIHHLAPRVPNYRLREAHNDVQLFKDVKPLTWPSIWKSWRLRLVDENSGLWSDFPEKRPTDFALVRRKQQQAETLDSTGAVSEQPIVSAAAMTANPVPSPQAPC